ncbi:OmpA family protein [Chitinophaga sp. Hz27]|uniref:OmpA family protein n=1 Tax=Chitinophaga sp. Hz27 TaxID=3347169 RepID=UPI0035D744F6
MPTKPITSYILFQGAVILFASCSFVKDSGSSAFGDMSKVNRAERLYKRQDYEHAISLCNAVLNNGGNENVTRKAKLQLARIYYETRQFEKTISLYDEVLYKPGPDIAASDVTNYLDLLKRTGRVNKAKEITDQYQKDYKEDTRFKNISQSLDNYYGFFNRTVEEGTHVDSLRLNLPGYQYGLALYKENIVFLSNDVKKKDAQSLYTNSKLYILSEEGVTPFNNSLRGVLQIGPASFYDNGQKVIYTSNKFSDVRNEKNGFINNSNGTQLLFATFQAEHNSWSKPFPVLIGKNNISASILHPSVAPDGKRLYFASDMPGGFGGTDIYYTDWDATEKRWKAPVNMGPNVNTNGNELYPFISANKLFFSSNGLEGFGGLDIFVIDINNQAKGAEHLPFPVNTQFDDLNPVLDDTKRLLYFTSDRSGVHDNDHIYVLSLANDPLKQVGISYPDTANHSDKSLAVIQTDSRRQETITGDTRYDNAISNEPFQPAPSAKAVANTPSVVDSRTTIDYGNSAANSSPEMISWQYQAGTPQAAAAAAITKTNAAAAPDRPVNSNPEQLDWQNGAYANADTKKIVATNPDVIAWQKANHIADTKMDSIIRAANMLLRMPGIIYFDLNSYVPMDQEWKKLDSIFHLWKIHPERLILISGHTDIIGTEKYNLSLSKNRAVYIQECLKSRGVDPEKIRISYFGSTKPVWVAGGFSLDHDREMFIQLQGVNRRCEVKIL